MTQKIICFGDSNTYGFDCLTCGRLSKNLRWTGILNESPDLTVCNYGENGLEIPEDPWDLADLDRILSHEAPFDLLIIMLGSNDLLTMYRSGMNKISQRMAGLLYHILEHPAIDMDASKILLIAPTPTQLARTDPYCNHYDQVSRGFGSAYKQLAAAIGTHFADAGQWDIELGPDGVHFTANGHLTFALKLEALLKDIL